jgi:hypothetical protein
MSKTLKAMFALNSNSYLNTPLFPARMQWGYKAWDSGPSLNQDCLKALGGVNGSDGWKCMFGGVAAGFVKTPLFVINSKYDTWQEKAIIGANVTITDPSIAPAAKAFWIGYGNTMVKMLEALPTQHGYFVSNCPAHCQTGTNSSWTSMYGARFPTEIYTRGCHWIPRMFAGSEHACDQ